MEWASPAARNPGPGILNVGQGGGLARMGRPSPCALAKSLPADEGHAPVPQLLGREYDPVSEAVFRVSLDPWLGEAPDAAGQERRRIS